MSIRALELRPFPGAALRGAVLADIGAGRAFAPVFDDVEDAENFLLWAQGRNTTAASAYDVREHFGRHTGDTSEWRTVRDWPPCPTCGLRFSVEPGHSTCGDCERDAAYVAGRAGRAAE